MMQNVILVPQGGLGNQLIQYSYAQSLASRTGINLIVNPVLMEAAWAHLRRISLRSLSPWLIDYYPSLCGGWRCFLDLLHSKAARWQGRVLGDTFGDDALMTAIVQASNGQRLWMLGYYQRCQAFSVDALPLWEHVIARIQQDYVLFPYPEGKVVVHIRLGDYLLPRNRRLFALSPLRDILARGVLWRNRLGGDGKVDIISDDPIKVLSYINHLFGAQEREQFRVRCHGSEMADFIELSRYRHIVASNSTFSLCAGHLSWLMWGEALSNPPLLLPLRWYVDDTLNAKQMWELALCPSFFALA